MKIVTIGGGTGQYSILQALQCLMGWVDYPIEITAIPATSDDGGSSGQLRIQQEIFAVGDLSQCAFGLHPKPELVAPILGGQRLRGESFGGHTVRNVISLAYFDAYGHTQRAMDQMGEALGLVGTIAPVTFTQTKLHAQLGSGEVIKGEDAISKTNVLEEGGIQKLWLEPEAHANMAAVHAIRQADLLIVCPGTLACSIIPNFLVETIVPAMQTSRGLKVLVANLMNRLGHEPEEWSVLDHVEYLEQYLGKGFFQVLLCNTQALTPAQVSHYKEEKIALPLRIEDDRVRNRIIIAQPLLQNGSAPLQAGDAIAAMRSPVRHDPEKVAHALRGIIEVQGMEKQVPWLLLDFDRTVFDTEGFVEHYQPHLASYVDGPAFVQDELAAFLFPDVVPMLQWAKDNRFRIGLVTQCPQSDTDFQQRKVAASGLHHYIDEYMYVESGQRKGTVVAKKLGKGVRGVFVDDLSEVAESIGSECKRLIFVQIDRRHGHLGKVRSLDQVRPFLMSLIEK
jgi:uncharacterized cofD-like protein